MSTYRGRVQQAHAWMRAHPRVADGMLAPLLLASGAGQSPSQLPGAARGIAVSLLLAATVAMRRRNPVAAFSAAVIIVAVQLAYGLGSGGIPGLEPGVTDLAVVILLRSPPTGPDGPR